MGIDLYESVIMMIHAIRLIILLASMRERRRRTTVRVEVLRLSIKIDKTKEPPEHKS